MKTLLLNSDYRPLKIISWERAIVLSLLNKVDVIKESDKSVIRTSRQVYKLPVVIKLKKFTNKFRKALPFSKSNIYLRDKGVCQYCGHFISKNKATIDHILPRSLGGKTSYENCVLACEDCNNYKADLPLEKAGMSLLNTPKAPKSRIFDISTTQQHNEWNEWSQWFQNEDVFISNQNT